jgi:hypothetical protein
MLPRLENQPAVKIAARIVEAWIAEAKIAEA